ISIFIDSRTTNVAPASTRWPAETSTECTFATISADTNSATCPLLSMPPGAFHHATPRIQASSASAGRGGYVIAEVGVRMIVVVLVLLALAVGVVAGYVSGGRLRHLRDDPPIRSRLILTALGLYVMGVAGSWACQPLLAGSTAAFWAVLAFCAWLNRRRHGARLIAFGLGLNALVILLNGA